MSVFWHSKITKVKVLHNNVTLKKYTHRGKLEVANLGLNTMETGHTEMIWEQNTWKLTI